MNYYEFALQAYNEGISISDIIAKLEDLGCKKRQIESIINDIEANK